jgi:hypothetical protein
MEEMIPCHMRHPEPFNDHSCVYGHCLACHNHHCAFDLCIPDAQIVGIATVTLLKPGEATYERTKQQYRLN